MLVSPFLHKSAKLECIFTEMGLKKRHVIRIWKFVAQTHGSFVIYNFRYPKEDNRKYTETRHLHYGQSDYDDNSLENVVSLLSHCKVVFS